MKKTLTLALAIGITTSTLSGCSVLKQKQTPLEQYQAHFMSVTPTYQSVEPIFIEAKQKALNEPTTENIEAFNYVLGLKRLLGQNIATGDLGIKHKQVSRKLSIDWGNDQRGGAAMRQPAYIHTLSGGVRQEAPSGYEISPQNVTVNVPPKHLLGNAPLSLSATSVKLNGSQEALSMYELSRWERYCNNGKGMDQRDWEFVRKAGLENVPSILSFDCKPPVSAGRYK